MRYPNASQGMGKLYVAAILDLITSLCGAAAAIMAVMVASAAASATTEALTKGTISDSHFAVAGVGGIGTLIFGLGALVIGIIALVMQIKGVNLAKLDETETTNFQTAFYIIVVALICSVLAGVLKVAAPTFGNILTAVAEICPAVIAIFVLQGIEALAQKIGETELAQKAKSIIMIIVAIYIISAVLSIITNFAASSIGLALGVILTIASVVLSIIETVLYITILKRARDTFAQ